MGFSLPVLNRRRRMGTAAFSPVSLFSAGEQGFWLEPSDLTTMFQDRAGTTPVTTPGQTVGLRLDKSKGLTLGSELVTPVANQDFSSDTGYWVKGGGATISGGKANFSASSGYVLYRGGVSGIAVGGYYEFTFTVSDYVSGSIRPYLGATPAFGASVSANGTYTARLGPGAGAEVGFNSASAFTGSIDNVSIKAITGNHAVAPTDAARPTYGIEPWSGRRNLLTYSEDFAAGPWLIFGGGSKTGFNVAVAPDGTTTADSVRVTTAGTGSNIYQQPTYTVAAVPYTFSCYVKRNAASDQTFQLFNNFQSAQTSSGNLTATDTWQRFSLTSTSNAGSALMLVGIIGNTSGTQADVLVWGAQLELGSTATAYQRVGTDFDVTEAGVPTVHYVQYDGTDDSFSTSSIDFSATDKMSVFAGVRKLSDAAAGVIVELSQSINVSPGSFYLLGPRSTSTTYDFTSRGSVVTGTAFISGYVAPITNILTGLGDISGDRMTLRVNGTQVAQDTSDQGTGNFGNYPLYIGRRNNASLPFNGRDYGIIIVGKTASATEITNTESYLAANTSGVTL